MTYTATIEIKSGQLQAYEEMFAYGENELIEYGIPRLDNIKTWTGKFSNGYEVDVQINSSEDDVWSQAVLFTPDFHEVCFTEVCDSLGGEWEFEADGDVYKVKVIGID